MQLKALLSCFGTGVAGEKDDLSGPSGTRDRRAPADCLRGADNPMPSSSPETRALTDYQQLDAICAGRLESRSRNFPSVPRAIFTEDPSALLRTQEGVAARKSEPELRRDAMICSRMPAAVTVFTLLGQVIHQNSASTFYFGDRINGTTSESDVLALVFQLEPDKFSRMLRDIDRQSGGRWRGIVRVPSSLVAAVGQPRSKDLRPAIGDGAISPKLPGMPHSCSRTTAVVVTDTMVGSPRGMPDGPTGREARVDGEDAGGVAAVGADDAAAVQDSRRPAPPQPPEVPELSREVPLLGGSQGLCQGPETLRPSTFGSLRAAPRALQLPKSSSMRARLNSSPARPATPPPLPPESTAPEREAAETAVAGSGAFSGGQISLAAPLAVAVPQAAGPVGAATGTAEGVLAAEGLHGSCQAAASGRCASTATLSLDCSRPRIMSQTTTTMTATTMQSCGTTSLTANGQPPTAVTTSHGHFVDLTATATAVSRADFPETTSAMLRQPELARQHASPSPCPVGIALREVQGTAAMDAAAAAAAASVDAVPAAQSLLWDTGADPLATSTFGLALGRPVDALSVTAVAQDASFGGGSALCSTGPDLDTGAAGSGALAAGDGNGDSRRSSVTQGGGGGLRVVDMAAAGRRRSVSQRTMSLGLGPGQPVHRTSSFLMNRRCASPACTPGSAAGVGGGGGGGSGHPFNSRPPSMGSLSGSPHSRALAFASSLRNAPMGTHMLAEGGRRDSLHMPRPHSRSWVEAAQLAGVAPPAPRLLAHPLSAASAASQMRARSGRGRGGPPTGARDVFLHSRRSVDVGQTTRLGGSCGPAQMARSSVGFAGSLSEMVSDVAAAVAAAMAAPQPPPSPAVARSPPGGAVASAALSPVPTCLMPRGGVHGAVSGSAVRQPTGSPLPGGRPSRPPSATSLAYMRDGDAALVQDRTVGSTAATPGAVSVAPRLMTYHGGSDQAPHSPGQQQQQQQEQQQVLEQRYEDERGGARRPSGHFLASAGSRGSGSWAAALFSRISSFNQATRRSAATEAAAAGPRATTVGTGAGPATGEPELRTGSLGAAQRSAPQPEVHAGPGQQDPPQWPPEEQSLLQALGERRLRQPLQAQLPEGAGGAGVAAVPMMAAAGGPQEDCWHEIWAAAALDPITGQEVVVLSQHDVTAKVVAERHLALVMEAEHRLLEQLFPKHILTHVTEEWIAEAERAAAAETRSVPPLPTPKPSARWRPVIRDCNSLATWHPQVTLLFADIRGFTPMCKQVTPREVMTMLNDLFSRFDEMLDKFGVFKVETIGDCYFVAGGLIQEDEDGMAAVRDEDSRGDPLHAHKVFMFAKAMLAAAREVRMPSSGEPVQIRIGISSGPVVSGVVGTRMPRFCLFGDTVNTTSRMESTGQPGAIHASESAYALLRSESWEPTGGIEVKGKGRMQTYLWRPNQEAQGSGTQQMPTCSAAAAAAAVAALKLRRGGGEATSTNGSSVAEVSVRYSAAGAGVAAVAAASTAAIRDVGTTAEASGVAGAYAKAAAVGLYTTYGTSGKPTEAGGAFDDYSDPLVEMLLNHAD